MTKIRPAEPRDLADFYAISLATGDHGQDASPLHDDPKLVGHLYSAPYLALSPETCLVVEDEQGVAGYAVGAMSTQSFEQRLEREWLPSLRARYSEPDVSDRPNWTADQRRIHFLFSPQATPPWIVSGYPSHLHLNLLPRLQGKGAGSALLNAWLSMAQALDVKSVHVGVSAQNARGLRFWATNKFTSIEGDQPAQSDRTMWLGRHL